MITLTHPQQMLLEAISANLRGERVRWGESNPSPDWETLLHLAQVQHVLPMVYEAVYDCPAAQGERGILPFKQGVIHQVMAQAMRTDAFLQLYGFLTEKGFHPLVVKGIVCRAMYPQGDYRISGDEDILIPESEWEDCNQALREYGMEPTDSDDLSQHEIGWTKKMLYVELHRHLFPPENGAYGDLNDFFARAHERAADYPVERGHTVRSLCPHDHLLYLILHAYKHFIHSGFGIRQVCDIGLWAMRYGDKIDWNELYRQCSDARALSFAAAVLRLAQQYLALDIKLPQSWADIPADPDPMLLDLLSGGIYGAADMSRLHSASVTVNAVAADRQNTRHSVWASVFPAKEKLVGQYPELRQHPGRLPLVWAKRLMKYAKETGSSDSNNTAESLRIAKERTELLRYYHVID